MKWTFRALALLLCFGLLAGSVFAAGTLPFQDVSTGDWFYPSVEYCYSRGLMNGVGNGEFEPEEGLSRAMFVTTLYRAAGAPGGSEWTPFYDVPQGTWYSAPVAWAYSQGIVNGVSATSFAPDELLTRQQLVTLLYRYAQYLGQSTDDWASLSPFYDAGQIADYAKNAFHWAYACGLIKGTDDYHLSPEGTCTRAQCATFLFRFLEGGYQYGSSMTRPTYNLGQCRALSGQRPVVLFFMDDDESSWTEAEISTFWYNTVIPGLDYLEARAADHGVFLDFLPGYYANGVAGVTLKYNGYIDNDLMDGTYNTDLLSTAATCLGYASEEALNEGMKQYYGTDEVIMLVLVDKPGRSFCLNDQFDDGYTFMEHCVVYSCYDSTGGATVPATIAHETLHLYGAEDYYDPYGQYPNRLTLAQKIYPSDIMLTVYYEIEYNTLGPFTAYTVGWTDTIPEECRNMDWWS